MAIAATNMSNDQSNNTANNNNNDRIIDDDDDHEHDMVMPGFRFHPTEEELVEFYLRRKVEGKRFNVELITFLDLYRYDPWELPAFAAIGEKEWFFYVPRDRKYRNGDRPNRVTTSGYWKATGADRMIRTDNSRSIGLKKTLVFYSGKAPKGIRTSWIMNEYRLPHHETEKYQKAEISLCRVYKRAGVEDHPSLPRCLSKRPSSSSRGSTQSSDNKNKYNPHNAAAHHAMERSQSQQIMEMEKISDHGSSTTITTATTSDITTALGLSKQNVYRPMALGLPSSVEEEEGIFHNQTNKQNCSLLGPNCTTTLFATVAASSSHNNVVDDLHRLVNYQQAAASMNHLQQQYYNDHQHHSQLMIPSISAPQSQSQALAFNILPTSLPITAFSDRLWEWNPIPEANRDQFTHLFK